MNQWFECKVRCDKTLEDGSVKRVVEPYLIEAVDYTEAEARFTAEVQRMVLGGDFEITDIKKTRISEVLESDKDNDDVWFRAKIALITSDEKRVMQNMMVQAQDLRVALKHIDNAMQGTMGEYVITNVSETGILGVFRYKPSHARE